MREIIAVWLTAGVCALALSGCNTIQGVGQDVKAAGGAVEKAARDAKPK